MIEPIQVTKAQQSLWALTRADGELCQPYASSFKAASEFFAEDISPAQREVAVGALCCGETVRGQRLVRVILIEESAWARVAKQQWDAGWDARVEFERKRDAEGVVNPKPTRSGTVKVKLAWEESSPPNVQEGAETV